MKLMQWICRYRWIGLPVAAATALTACGGSSDTEIERLSNLEFIQRTLPSGLVPSEWNYIWGCEVSTRAGRNTSVPLRFYRDGQLLVGIGTSEQLGTWEVKTPVNTAWTEVSVTLDEPAPQFFGSDNTKLEFVLWRHGENYMETGGTYVGSALTVEDVTEFNFTCARYNQVGEVEGDDLPGWMRRFEETPSFITVGDANAQFTPYDDATSDDAPATAPSAPAATPEPVQTPATQTPTSELVATPTPSSPADGTTSASSAPLANINNQVESIWYIGDYRDTVMGLEINYSSVIEFTNNEVSRDGETISNEGIAESKRRNPDDWGEGRIRSGLLSYKWSNSRSWQEPFLSAPTTPYPRNQKIRGCYRDTLGIQGPGSTPTITRLCLSVDGTFNLGSNSAGSGTYLIEGFAIRLSFSGGERAEFLMGAHKDSEGFITALIIGDRQFRPD